MRDLKFAWHLCYSGSLCYLSSSDESYANSLLTVHVVHPKLILSHRRKGADMYVLFVCFHFVVCPICVKKRIRCYEQVCVLCIHCPRIIKRLFLVIIFIYVDLVKLFHLYSVFIFWIIYFVFAVALSSFISSFYYVRVIGRIYIRRRETRHGRNSVRQKTVWYKFKDGKPSHAVRQKRKHPERSWRRLDQVAKNKTWLPWCLFKTCYQQRESGRLNVTWSI